MSETALANVQVNESEILKHLGLNPSNPAAQALVLTCRRYGLDPILKHAVLIKDRLYVTRDGLLHVAHQSKKLDGMVVLEQSETQTHHVATVAVYRKDMTHPFTYVGRYPKNGGNKHYGPEMAVKCAEVMALRRAFDVSLAAREEVWDEGEAIETTASASAPSSEAPKEEPSHEIGGNCPHCGSLVAPNDSSNANAPKWRCSNAGCTGNFNKKKNAYEPWVSWNNNPWKPGGEIEIMFGKGSAQAEPTAASPSSDGPREDPPSPAAAPSQGSLGGEADPVSANPSEGDPAERFDFNLSLIEEAVMGGITVRGVKLNVGSATAKANRLAADLGYPTITETMTSPAHLSQALSERPPALAAAIVDDLDLVTLLSGVAG